MPLSSDRAAAPRSDCVAVSSVVVVAVFTVPLANTTAITRRVVARLMVAAASPTLTS